MAIYPTMKPSTICRYEYPLLATIPGTDMNVTPEMVAPIIENATNGHGARRLPVKNVALSLPREDTHDTPRRMAKYTAMVIMITIGVDI
jgi:hypothetical protein